MKFQSRLSDIISQHQQDLLKDWVREQTQAISRRSDLINEGDLVRESKEFLRRLENGLRRGASLTDVGSGDWTEVRDFLDEVSRSRGLAGFSPSETAMFVFSFKQPLFTRLRQEYGDASPGLADEMWGVTVLLDKFGLYTTEVYQKSREEVIRRQQEEMLELSTPVVKLWDGILALPLIGTLDSARTQVVMESMLQRIVETGSEVAIIDITGVPQVDTLVAQHLLKTVTAARLMGADCIISGIRPQIAQTIVHLGVNLGDITTKSNMADAFMLALSRTGRAIGRVSRPGQGAMVASGAPSATPGLRTAGVNSGAGALQGTA